MTKPFIIITGASSGIGKATAQLLSKKGYPLLLLGRRIEKMQDLDLPNCLCEKVDVTDRRGLLSAYTKAKKQFSQVGGIINNAGLMLLGEMENQDPQEWQNMIDVNISAVLNGIHTVLPDMVAANAGTIINISSIAGRKTFPNHGVYCATKFAVHGLSESLREEVANHDIRVVTIAPGVVQTELLGHTSSEKIISEYESWKADVGKVLDPEDVAHAILYAYEQPKHVCVREIVLAATRQLP